MMNKSLPGRGRESSGKAFYGFQPMRLIRWPRPRYRYADLGGKEFPTIRFMPSQWVNDPHG